MTRQQRALRTRQALITAAATVFDRDGYSTASLTAISSLAQVSNGALHFHFANKAALAGAVQQAAAQQLDTLLQAHREQAGNALQLLVNTSHGLARALAADVVLRAGFELSRGRARTGTGPGLHQQWHAWVGAALTRAAREGVLGEVAPEAVATFVVAATTGFEVLGTRDSRWLSHTTLTRFWQLLLPRLAAAPALTGLTAAGTRPH
ncbi:ScbR family autoregulator-binding transcription factor [Streptomyces sp. NPDC048171]|uniref:ScbR family autoregulator-binding transcription factor n=1 Tax=Streptomyces sp. NPDC048171 TaxID=3365504 RepID=UPI00371D014D